jgi:hypothetical protein
LFSAQGAAGFVAKAFDRRPLIFIMGGGWAAGKCRCVIKSRENGP